MLADTAIEDLREALGDLADPSTVGLWGAVESLGRMQKSGLDVVIDFRATSRLRAPVILVSTPDPARALLAQLSPRRREVAELMLQGASNKEIARSMGLSLGTVKDHVHDIFAILGIRSRAALMTAALRR
jgi:two-component system nitrate/nitrite response regulator NarL